MWGIAVDSPSLYSCSSAFGYRGRSPATGIRMTITAVLTFLGGIGLFLLGMKLMTEGLTTAAGDTLRTILSAATRSRFRAVISGMAITALVQSSGAVIFTTVGFVNASLLSLAQAVGIIYGSNVGTTVTSWIVALLGFNLDLQALSMPMIGVGMTISVMVGDGRWGALGRALAGFGLFFLGIDVLRGAFDGLGDAINLAQWADRGIPGLLLFLLIGSVLTILMQSSSASLAVTLTAAAGGLIPLTAAAAMVIGANVGSTTTGLFAVFGATANAKRAATAHVIFNVVTGTVSFLMMPVLLWGVEQIVNLFPGESAVATSLAIFHTLVNLIGILIMWPLTGLLVKFLEQRFKSTEEDAARPRFLDRNVQQTPSLAFDALAQELHRMNGMANHLAREAISAEDRHNPNLEAAHRILENLSYAISEFASGIPRHGLNSEQLSALPDAQRVAQYLVNLAEHAQEMVVAHPLVDLAQDELNQSRNQLRAHAVALLDLARVDQADWKLETLNEARAGFESEYQAMKAALLHAGTAGELDPRRMIHSLERMSDLHRVIDQASKAAVYLDRYIRQTRVVLTPPPEVLAAVPDTNVAPPVSPPQESPAEEESHEPR